MKDLRRIEYELHASQGLLAGGAIDAPRRQSTKSDSLKSLLATKASLDEKASCDIMIGAFECLEMIVNSEMINVDDILGAEDIFTLNEKEEVFRDINVKFSLQ